MTPRAATAVVVALATIFGSCGSRSPAVVDPASGWTARLTAPPADHPAAALARGAVARLANARPTPPIVSIVDGSALRLVITAPDGIPCIDHVGPIHADSIDHLWCSARAAHREHHRLAACSDPSIRTEVVELLAATGRTGAAIARADDLLETAPTPALRVVRARLALDRGDVATARELLTLVADLDAPRGTALARGLLALAERRPARALAFLTSAVQGIDATAGIAAARDARVARLALARAQHESGAPQDALETLASLRRTHPATPEAHTARTRIDHILHPGLAHGHAHASTPRAAATR